MYDLFDRPAEKLQKVLVVSFWIGIALAAITAFKLVIEEAALLGMIEFVAFSIVMYLSTLVSMAFLQLVEDARKSRELLESMEKRGSSPSSQGVAPVYNNAQPQMAYMPQAAPMNAAPRLQGNEWRCLRCGTVNPTFVGTCSCGNTR